MKAKRPKMSFLPAQTTGSRIRSSVSLPPQALRAFTCNFLRANWPMWRRLPPILTMLFLAWKGSFFRKAISSPTASNLGMRKAGMIRHPEFETEAVHGPGHGCGNGRDHRTQLRARITAPSGSIPRHRRFRRHRRTACLQVVGRTRGGRGLFRRARGRAPSLRIRR